jgi:TonB family protein
MLLAFLIAVTLAAPPNGARVPGCRLRLGMSEKQAQAIGEFVEAKAPGAPGMEARKGELKFFGLACDATLFFKDGVLARVRFEANGVAPHSIDYVEDQLRRARMLRECSHYDATEKICDWMGESRLHLEIKAGHLAAQAEPAASADATEPAAAEKATEGGAFAGTAAVKSPTSAEAKTAAPAPASPAPSSATPASPSPPAAPSSTPPAATSAPASETPTLPETLTISLVTRNSPSDWPRIVSSPPLEYPDAARRESVQGIVWVLALVNADGTVQSAAVDRGVKELNDAAVSWIQRSKFAPCARDNRPCRFWVRVAVRFTLY